MSASPIRADAPASDVVEWSPDRRDDPTRCIAALGLGKTYHTEVGPRRVLNDISFAVGPGERIAVLGRNGAGKSTLIRLLAGLELPTRGRIHRGLKMSWPIALGGGFEGTMTGYDTVRFITKAYGVPFKESLEYVAEFTELGTQLYVPIRFYSDGMRARLAFALSLAIDFECFLIDEVILVGDQRFQRRCQDELFSRRSSRAMILAVHDMGVVKEYCDAALIMSNGRGRVFDDLDLAGRIYESL